MKRSEINEAIIAAHTFFTQSGWVLPPNAKWDVTDFGLGVFSHCGLVLVNLAEEAEYCEKIMYATKNQRTPSHAHRKKKEDIICRAGMLAITLWSQDPLGAAAQEPFEGKINGVVCMMEPGKKVLLSPGERITIPPLIWHEFEPLSGECMIGEVSTANDDLNDNFFSDKNIGRFSNIVEDAEPLVKLLSEQ